MLRAAPRVLLAMVVAILYSTASGVTQLALLVSWIVLIGSMVVSRSRWRYYVETGKRGGPPRKMLCAGPPGGWAGPAG